MKYFKLLCMGVAMVLFSACGSSPKECVDELNSRLDEVEKECANYSEEDWADTTKDIEELISQLESNSEEMTQEERADALKAIGRYYGLSAKQGLKEAADVASEALKSLPALIEGFTGAFEEE